MSLVTPVYSESNLTGYLYAGIGTSDSTIKVVFKDKITGSARTPQSNTLLFVIDPGSPTFPNSNYEIVLATSSSTSGGITTLTGVTRGLAFYGTSMSAGTGVSHLANAEIGCMDSHYFFNIVTSLLDGTNSGPALKLGVPPIFELTGVLADRVFANAAARDAAITSPSNGMSCYLTDQGQAFDYIGGTWTARASGTNPNASTSVAGKVQIATSAQIIAGTGIGSSGAVLGISPDNLASSGMAFQPGMVQMYSGATAPTGWLPCDGSSVLRASYAALFAVIGTTYGSADGSHFNVPDMRGRVPVGVGTGTGGGASGNGLPTGGSALTARALGDWLGEETHTLTTAEMPSHTHTVSYPYGGSSPYGLASTANTALTVSTGSTGGGGAHNNIQPAMTLNFIIKT